MELTVQRGSSLAKVLIENKIGARLQPLQAERYSERAAAYLEGGSCQSVTTVIVAPKVYLGSEHLGFDKLITYELVLAWFEAARGLGDRSQFKRKLLSLALQPSAWIRTADPVTTEFRHKYWQVADVVAPELGLEAPGPCRPAPSSCISTCRLACS